MLLSALYRERAAKWYSGWRLLPHSQGTLGPPCVKFACTPRVSVGFLWALLTSSRKHA